MDFLKEFELIEEKSREETSADNTLSDEELKTFLEDIKVIGSQSEKKSKPGLAKENLEKLLLESYLSRNTLKEKKKQSPLFLTSILSLLCLLTLGAQGFFFYFFSKNQLETQSSLKEVHMEVTSLRDELKDVEFVLENPPFPKDETIELLPSLEDEPFEIPYKES